MEEDRLIVYKKENCFKCEQVMEILKRRNIDFIELPMIKHKDELKDYPYYAQNLYPIMKKGDKYITLRDIFAMKSS